MAHRLLAGLVFIAEGKLLLVLSRKDEGRCCGGWSIPKGRHTNSDDGDLFETALRELKEETGVDLGRLYGREIGEGDSVASGTLKYARKGRPVELHYFVIRSRSVVLDSFSAAAESMSGIGLFTPALALKLIRREQRPLVKALLLDARDPAEDTAGVAYPLGMPRADASRPAFIDLRGGGIMSNAANRKGNDSTSSGHGALGMGGEPSDDPRDIDSGGGDDFDDDYGGGTGPVPGASGGTRGDTSGGQVAGMVGDEAVTEDIEKTTKKGGR